MKDTKSRFKGKYRIESTRLKGRDYTSAGYYFVTICTGDRQNWFGEIVSGMMRLNSNGETAQRFWLDIPNHFENVSLDAFIVMPNHVHGIVVIVETLHATSLPQHATSLPQHATSLPQHATSLRESGRMSGISPKRGSLSAVIRSYKSAVTRQVRLDGSTDFAWQSRYYDHIIRDEKSFDRIRAYILGNPVKWETDEHFMVLDP